MARYWCVFGATTLVPLQSSAHRQAFYYHASRPSFRQPLLYLSNGAQQQQGAQLTPRDLLTTLGLLSGLDVRIVE